MKYFFVGSIILFCSLAKAYVYEIETKNLINPSQFQAYQFQKHFSSLGYNSIGGLNSLTNARFRFDQAFVSYNWKEAILLKAGLKAPKEMNGVIIEDSTAGVFAFHFSVEDESFLLLGMGVNRADFEKAVKPWVKTKVSWLSAALFSSAQAEECRLCDIPKSKSNARLTSESLDKQSTLQTIGRCATDSWSGFEGSVNGTLEFFRKLGNDPKALWLEMKQSFVELKEFVLNLGDELQGMLENFKGLSTEEKTTLICTFTGQLMGGAAQALVAGAAIGKILPGLLLKSKQSISTLKQIAQLEEKGIKLPNKSRLIKDAVNCGI